MTKGRNSHSLSGPERYAERQRKVQSERKRMLELQQRNLAENLSKSDHMGIVGNLEGFQKSTLIIKVT